MSKKTDPAREFDPTLEKIIDDIQSEEIRSLIRKQYNPDDLIKGFWYALALAILKLQEGKNNG